MQLRQILATNLKRAMGDDSQAEVAKRAGIAQSHVSRILRCEASATTDLIGALARALRMQPWELLVDDQMTRKAALERMILGPSVADPEHMAPRKEAAFRRTKKGENREGDSLQ